MTCALEKTNRLEVTRKKPRRIWNWRLGGDRVAGKGLGSLGFTWGRWKSQSSRKRTYTVGPFASWRMTCQARDGGVVCRGCRGQTAEADVLLPYSTGSQTRVGAGQRGCWTHTGLGPEPEAWAGGPEWADRLFGSCPQEPESGMSPKEEANG